MCAGDVSTKTLSVVVLNDRLPPAAKGIWPSGSSILKFKILKFKIAVMFEVDLAFSELQES